MRSARVAQPISLVPASIRGTVQGAHRAVILVLPRLGRGLAVRPGRKSSTVVDLATGQSREMDKKEAAALLAELEAIAKAAAPAAEGLRGRWSASVAWPTGAPAPQIQIRRRISYVDLLVEYAPGLPGRWVVVPPKRRPTWFSEPADWTTERRTVATLAEACHLAIGQAQDGITHACQRRDMTRKDVAPDVDGLPKVVPKPRTAKRAAKPKSTGVQRALFGAGAGAAA